MHTQQAPTARPHEVFMSMLAAAISPYMVGALDYDRGDACNYQQFDKDGHQGEYHEGWHAARAAALGIRWQLMLGTNWHHYMDFDSYEAVVAELEGYKRDIIASGYQPSDIVIGCWERKGADGEPICHMARIVDRGTAVAAAGAWAPCAYPAS